ncbi:MAG: hypothetical protein J6E38_07415 [Clostridia bacterium]|nr:hypothetical protein [Clostridia bacterium]
MKRLYLTGGAIILTLILVLILVFSCTRNKEPDAIIILPGIMGSDLFLAEQAVYDGDVYPADTKLWIDIDSVRKIFKTAEHIRMLAPENNFNIRPDAPVINDLKTLGNYGAMNTYGVLYKQIYSQFHDTCDVILYNYDWREDPYETARKLDRFISERDYQSVSFVAHSMGGLVASHYFAMGKTQRSKVNTFLSLGTPYLGSEQASNAMLTGNISGFIANVFISDEIRNICPKLDSMYALLPYEHLWRSSLAVYDLTGSDRSLSFEDEEHLLEEFAQGYSQKQHDTAKRNKELLFTEKGKHISELVNSYYLAGDGQETVSVINLPKIAELSNTLSTTSKTSSGDGTVSLYSATVAGTLPKKRTFIKSEDKKSKSSHDSLADGSDISTMDFIIEVLKGNADKMSDSDLERKYNIRRASNDK